MTIDAGGIQVYNPKWSVIGGSGVLTSNQQFIDISLPVRTIEGSGQPHYGLSITSVIADSTNKVGLRITGNRPAPAYASVVLLQGDKSNTFTGDVVISGASNYLALGKTNGAIAVQGNVFVQNKAILRLDQSGQLSHTTRITLNNGTLYLGAIRQELETKFKSLIIEGNGALSFGHNGTHAGNRYVYLDELVIKNNGWLNVVEWEPGRDHILVKKTMNKMQLDKMLSRVRFKGWLPGRTHLESYDGEYWAISGTPEPETYGAILGTVGLGLVMWRKQRRRL